MSLDQWAITLFTFLFCVQTMRKHQFQWFWYAVVVWLAVGILSGRMLPNILGLTTWSNLYLIHFYAFVGSIFFFINSVERLPNPDQSKPRQNTWHSPKAGAFLSLFATSSLVMHCAMILLALMVWWQYPNGYTPLLPARLFFLYALSPIYWYSIQILIIIIFILHRIITKDAWHVFSLGQLQASGLICLILFFFHILNIYEWIQYIPLIIKEMMQS